MTVSRKDELRAAIALAERQAERAARELERLERLPDFDELLDGSVIGITVGWPARGGIGRTYVYIAYKVGGHWFVTGEKGAKTSEELTTFLVSNRRMVGDIQILATIDVRPEPSAVFLDLGALGGLVR